MSNEYKIKNWMIELGYDILEEKESEATNFILIAEHRRERPGVLINIVSPKSRRDLIIVHSTNIMTGKGAEAFHRLKPETLTSLINVMNKNALLIISSMILRKIKLK